MSESPASPTTVQPAFLYASSARVRLVARATGTRAAAPADTFHAVAVTPAARRDGTTTPCAPKAAADRSTAPRLRGSVTPSSATSSAGAPASSAACQQVVGVRVVVGRHLQDEPLVRRPAGRSGRARSGWPPSAGCRASPPASATPAPGRRSSIRSATYSAVAGTDARSASTTGLRPATHSGPPSRYGPAAGARPRRPRRAARSLGRRPGRDGAPGGSVARWPSGSGPCPRARGGAGRPTRPSGPSSTPGCASRPVARCCRPSGGPLGRGTSVGPLGVSSTATPASASASRIRSDVA